MNKKVKAVIGLARGYMAFFDPVSRIMLDYSRPTAHIYEDTDVSGLKKALNNTIVLLSGSLDELPEATVEAVVEEPKVTEEVQNVDVVEDKEENEVAVEEVAEDVKEESKSKKRRKK